MKVCVAQSKGGVGKTTTACHLAYALARRGRVVLVDADSQAQCSRLLGVSPEVGLADVLDETVSLDEALTPARANLWLLAGSPALSGIARIIARQDMAPEAYMSERLSDLKADWVVIDTSPSWDSLSVNALCFADAVLSPVSMEVLSVDGFAGFRSRLEGIQRRHALPLRWVVPTALDRRAGRGEVILNGLRDRYGDLVTDPIRFSSRIAEAPAFGKLVFEHSPSDRAAADYARLARRIIDDG